MILRPASRRALALMLGGAGLELALGGFVVQPATPAQQKLIDHYTNDDPLWALLRTAKVGEDRAKGELTAAFPPAVAAMAGKPVRVGGFMTPLEARLQIRRFILTRRSTTCPFCPPNEPTEAVEVRLDTPIPLTGDQISVSGRLELIAASSEGLFYRLADAQIAK